MENANVCSRHTGLISAEYGSCAPLHWPHTGKSVYARAKRDREHAQLLVLRQELANVYLYGRIAKKQLEAEIRVLEESIR